MATYKSLGYHYDNSLTAAQKAAAEEWGRKYNAAKATGDSAGMDAAHRGAEAVRAQAGYSGGSDGSDYIPSALAYGNTASAYGNYSMPFSYSGYDDFYGQSGYGQSYDAAKNSIDARTQASVNALEDRRRGINADSDKLAREAYVSYRQSENKLPQQLSAAGYSGGMADSHRIGLEAGLQNRQGEIADNRVSALYGLDSEIQNARLQGDAQLAQYQAELGRDAMSAWNAYANQANAYARDDHWNKTNLDYQALQDTRAEQWNMRNFDYQRQRDVVGDDRYRNELNYQMTQDEYNQKYQQAVLAATYGDFTLLEGMGIDSAEAKRQWNTQLASTAAKAKGSGGTSSSATKAVQQQAENALLLYAAGSRDPWILEAIAAAYPGYTMDQILYINGLSDALGGTGGAQAQGDDWSGVDMASVNALGYGPVSRERLEQLVESGQVIATENNGKITFARADNSRAGKKNVTVPPG